MKGVLTCSFATRRQGRLLTACTCPARPLLLWGLLGRRSCSVGWGSLVASSHSTKDTEQLRASKGRWLGQKQEPLGP